MMIRKTHVNSVRYFVPEVSENAAIFIATSYQALCRAQSSNGDLRFCNSSVALIFACFYLEESMDVIIETLGKKEELIKFYRNRRNIGMFFKLYWIYNAYIAENKVTKCPKLSINKYDAIMDELNIIFPRFKELMKFRNDVSHGKINELANQIDDVLLLRNSAKNTVDKILTIVNLHKIRNVTYISAIENLVTNYHEGS